ncbi:MAG: hypothetical protein WC498_01060 [Candidatus Saccharimonadales bacterium]
MSIEYGFISDGDESNTNAVLGIIGPGHFARFADYSGDVHTIIFAICCPNNSGGEVYLLHGDDPKTKAVPHLDSAPEAFILPGETYEQPITTQTQQRGRIVLTHLISK